MAAAARCHRGLRRLLLQSAFRLAPGPASTPSGPAAATFAAQHTERAWRCTPVVHVLLARSPARAYASARTNIDEQVDKINEMFAEAREEIENAKEDAETTYFNESAAEAREAVSQVLDAWQGLLAQVPTEEERGKLVRSMGLKMEQLKAELEELDHLHA